jgi:Raf kinase inhibitor-like YbhB/YbcL family protein
MTLQVSSPAFADGAPIPRKYTCDGEDLAPPLEWQDVPDRTKSIAVICDDPDAPSGTFTHWVLYDVPASVRALAAGQSIGRTGVNSFGHAKYGGPCPPKGHGVHHYRFHVYALGVASLGGRELSKKAALDAMRGHILAEGEVVGTYERR